mgnify:FL=1
MTDRVSEVAGFYQELFGFQPTFETDWYVSLRREEAGHAWELAVLRYDHETIPDNFRKLSQGMIINLEVEDAAAAYKKLVLSERIEAVSALKDETFGQRHFIVSDPAGNLVDVIENISPSEDAAKHYVHG